MKKGVFFNENTGKQRYELIVDGVVVKSISCEDASEEDAKKMFKDSIFENERLLRRCKSEDVYVKCESCGYSQSASFGSVTVSGDLIDWNGYREIFYVSMRDERFEGNYSKDDDGMWERKIFYNDSIELDEDEYIHYRWFEVLNEKDL